MEGIIHYELLERNLASLLKAIVDNFAVWRKQSRTTPGSTIWSDSSA
jgi:hypothetical protein